VFADPLRDVVLQETHFIPLKGHLSDYRLYVLFTPHLATHGQRDHGTVADWKGVPMLFTHGEDRAAVLACSAPWRGRSAGYVGTSDGWQDVSKHKRMTWFYEHAGPGNVAVIAEVDLAACAGHFLLALGLGRSPEDAAHVARAGVLDGAKRSRAEYVRAWQDWQRALPAAPPREKRSRAVALMSRAVLRVHEAKMFPGGIVASLATPWGYAHNEWDLGGYHLVWSRDMVEAAGGLLAVGEHHRARQILTYLQTTQENDGHWFQNLEVNGVPYSRGLQLDETALPILQVDLAYREKALDRQDLDRYWPMIRAAASFLVQQGPVTQEDRWERNGGYAPFTLAVGIAALLAAADHAEVQGEHGTAEYLRATADARNDHLDDWLYVTGTEIARRCGVEGYYVRLAPAGEGNRAEPLQGKVPTTPHHPHAPPYPAWKLIGPDPLAFVRYGLRRPDDPHIVNTLRVVDALDKIETPV